MLLLSSGVHSPAMCCSAQQGVPARDRAGWLLFLSAALGDAGTTKGELVPDSPLIPSGRIGFL